MGELPAGVMLAVVIIQGLMILGAIVAYEGLGHTVQNLLLGLAAAAILGIVLLPWLVAGFGG